MISKTKFTLVSFFLFTLIFGMHLYFDPTRRNGERKLGSYPNIWLLWTPPGFLAFPPTKRSVLIIKLRQMHSFCLDEWSYFCLLQPYRGKILKIFNTDWKQLQLTIFSTNQSLNPLFPDLICSAFSLSLEAICPDIN